MPHAKYKGVKRKTRRVRFMFEEGEFSAGKDVELGQYLQTHGAAPSSPGIAQPPSLSLKTPSSPSSSNSHVKQPSWQLWSAVRKRHRPSPRSLSKVVNLLKLVFMLLGIVQCFIYFCGILNALFPDDLDLVSGGFQDSAMTPGVDEEWSQNPTADVQPLMCHSHNDYWRREPLYRALRVGCTGVESDVWHFEDELYVAHTISGIRQNRTLKSLYLDPLKDMLNRQNQLPDFLGPLSPTRNGVFATHPKQSLVLLIDFKNDPELIWRRLQSHLTYFRDKKYLTHLNGSDIVQGPLTIVLSGKAPFNRIVESSTDRDVFYDAPLDVMTSPNADTYSSANSYYASVSFVRSIGYPWHSALSHAQLDLLRRQIRGAHARGLKARYWGIPSWPVGLRNYIWRVLVREGVDYLSVDDVHAVTRDNWGPRKGGWGKKWWR